MRHCVVAPVVALALTASFVEPALAQQIDTARAMSALRDANAACRADGAALWAHSLCGPIALVDRSTRLVIANDSGAGQRFLSYGAVYVTTLPPTRFIANTSFEWGGRAWTMVVMPLPQDRYTRTALVMHEVFHREQKALALRQADALNNHLDFRDGRTWLRLEYRALARAILEADSAAARRHTENAMLFRARRRVAYPGSDLTEASLEMQEGLPEYTGHRLAMLVTGETQARVAEHVAGYEKAASFVRSFAYGSGPALGVLLDRFSPGWRDAVRTQLDPGALLGEAIGFRKPRDLAATARARAMGYDWQTVDSEEAARERTREPMLRDYRARLADGATITFQQTLDSLSWGFDPTALIAFDLTSVIYPSGSFSAPWGSLNVEKNGVWVKNDFSLIRVGIGTTPPGFDSREVSGDGWTLKLNPGWALSPRAAKPGSFDVVRR